MKNLYRILICLLALSLLLGNAFAETVELSGEGPASVSAITSVAGFAKLFDNATQVLAV